MKQINNKVNKVKKKPKKQVEIYTCLEDFNKPKNPKHISLILCPFEKLSEEFREWIIETSFNLMDNQTEAEKSFEKILFNNGISFLKQVFFRIDKHTYFLDFYLPDYKIAFEIDGSVHKGAKKYDNIRDEYFKMIGIKTIRIKNKDVEKVDIKELL